MATANDNNNNGSNSDNDDGAFDNVTVFRAGMKVKIQGLSKAAQFNGEEGVITGVNETGERFIVSLSGDRTVTVKPENMLSVDNPAATAKKPKPKPAPPASPTPASSSATSSPSKPSKSSKSSSKAAASSASSESSLNANPLKNLSAKDALKRANMLKSLDANGLKRLRQMNPAMKNLSDAEIRSQATQMELMAKNPEMFELAKKQMETNPQMMQQAIEQSKGKGGKGGKGKGKNQSGGVNPNLMSGMTPSADMFDNMSPEQMSDMFKMAREMAKTDPEGFKRNTGMDPAQIEALGSMDQETLQRTMGTMKTVIKYTKPLIRLYQTLNNATNGNARNIVLGVLFVLLSMLIHYLFFSSSPVPVPAAAPVSIEANIQEELNKAKEAFLNSQEGNNNNEDLEVNLD